MSTAVIFGQKVRFKTSCIILIVAAALMTINHTVLIFALDEPILFMGFTAFTLYALVVIAIPFRQHETWAWYASWIFPIGLAAAASTDSNIALFYYAVAATCVVGLLLTMRDFFAGDRQVGLQ